MTASSNDGAGGNPPRSVAIVVAEDRESCAPGLQTLVASLKRHAPHVDIVVNYPHAESGLVSWLRRQERLHLSVEPVPGASHWNVKPQALKRALRLGYEHVIWIDSDIIIVDPRIREVVDAVVGGGIVVTAEPIFGNGAQLGSTVRTAGWGFEPGRCYPRTLNSCIVGCSRKHLPLLKQWEDILMSNAYRAYQRQPVNQRPLHATGDQDVLTALLGSKYYEQENVVVLSDTRDIIQYLTPGCFTPISRLRVLLGLVKPFAVHAQGQKPWHAHESRSKAVQSQVDGSPYVYAARSLYKALDWQQPEWLRPQSIRGRALAKVAPKYYGLHALPEALVQYLGSKGKSILRRS